MSQFWSGNLFLLMSILLGSGSQIVFKALFNITGPLKPAMLLSPQILTAKVIVLLGLAFAMLVGGFVFWTLSLSRLDLSYAYPLACASALLVALFSVLFLGEVLTAKAILGTVLIVLGTAFIIPSR